MAWYSQLCRDVLYQPNRSLLVIGYSFRDKHLNKVIAEAVTRHGLRVHVLSPEPYDALAERLSRNQHGRAILPLSAYHCCTLVDMFPGDHRVTEAYGKLEKQFFDSG